MRHSIRFSFHFAHELARGARGGEKSIPRFRSRYAEPVALGVFTDEKGENRSSPCHLPSSSSSSSYRTRSRMRVTHPLPPPTRLLSHLSCFLHPLVAATRVEKQRRVFLPDYFPGILRERYDCDLFLRASMIYARSVVAISRAVVSQILEQLFFEIIVAFKDYYWFD